MPIRALVSSMTCLLTLSAASPQPLPAGEFLIDTSIVLVPTCWDEDQPDVTWDGTNYFVVWSDDRESRNDNVYGARVTPQGELLDPGGIGICVADDHQYQTAVGFNGTNRLVAWSDPRSGERRGVYAARVAPDGTVLDPNGIPVSSDSVECYPTAVASDGTNFLVVWERHGPNWDLDIRAARMSSSGVVLDPNGIAVSMVADSRQEEAEAAFDGTNYLVVWQDERNRDRDIYAARVSPAGMLLDPNGIAITTAAGDQGVPALAFDGTNYLVSWEDNRLDSFDVYCARVSPQGMVLDPEGIRLSRGVSEQYYPSVAFDGTNYLVSWIDWDGRNPSSVCAARVSLAGVVLDPEGFTVCPGCDGWYPAMAFGGGRHFAVWQSERTSVDVCGVRVTPQGTVLDSTGLLVSAVANEQWSPAAAFNGTNYLVAWEDYRNGDYADIYAARVTPQGGVLDRGGILVTSADGDQDWVAAVSDGTDYLVVWEDGRGASDDIYAARVTGQGVLRDTNSIAVCTYGSDQNRPCAAFGSTDYLVAWQDWRGGNTDIFAARVTPGGVVLDPDGIRVALAAERQELPALSWDGENWLVAWADRRSGNWDIGAARVSAQGAVLDTAGITVSAASGQQMSPALAFGSGVYLVVWEDGRSSNAIYGARVTPQGTVLDPDGIAIASGTAGMNSPAVAFDGSDFVVVWEDDRPGRAVSDIYGARVNPQGAVTDTFAIVREADYQGSPVLVHGSGNQTFLAYEGWTTRAGSRSCNALRIWGKLTPLAKVEETLSRGSRASRTASLVRGVLLLPASCVVRRASSVLLDISGRKVMELAPGANDVSRLASGVYFIRPASSAGFEASGIAKVVVTE